MFEDGPTVLVGGGFSMHELCLVALGCYGDDFRYYKFGICSTYAVSSISLCHCFVTC